MKKISLLGSTGSIGTQTLDVIAANNESFTLVALACGTNIELARKQIAAFQPKLVSVATPEDAKILAGEFGPEIEFLHGGEGLVEVARYSEADTTVTAITGSVGLLPTLAAIEAKKTIAIANKETLVTAGHIVVEAAKKNRVALIPVDSEHSAIFQALNGESHRAIERLIITASGGSFRDRSRDELKHVTVEQALSHPNWSMGAKITIDSATMMNKGLEVIEAKWLFGLDYDKIDVLIHKESIIHSMVEFVDRSVIAQLGTPDMRVPIQYALTYPERFSRLDEERLDLAAIGKLHFSEMDMSRYRCMKFAYDAGRAGGTMPTVLNAANEVAVARFLKGELTFLEIEDVIERALQAHTIQSNPTLEQIQAVDQEIRQQVSVS
ncbi:1-deoxy-D-xylulose 5-phosphate reductoisomerase [Bacillus sp. JCM 19046]|uniref:1-deoxy-D-xylulose 5-phosphate reductoisomerase n=1 Tax=Shouchella xiaoxiensis TaxID=766895 RepID=A0ABS2SQY6_9BACI|nr:1-deoxy-D-xylulose-5-phosphate reductoisomerase [Shouchella xiaoxiensis]MBM7837680.1 1-deoxy-D-xylulose-5-phosphate reductoisomerase [Shouchella xiaoxiensis]GAF12911.1 1-deoxy-D-xylulose 5-phosphate reductoisomerase [Bacillus sp. JCM 19045]GAF16719.1 1-deoxy-D-xylulose 5-phosphate reductoisomerase [Bacillus sp. JCM 19046]